MKALNFSKLEAYLFDLGGVILDISPQTVIEAFTKLGLKEVEEHINQCHHQGLFKQYERGDLSSEAFIADIQSRLPAKVSAGTITRAWNSMLVQIPKERIRLLAYLSQRAPVYLLSNTNALHHQAFIGMAEGYSNLESLFTKVFYSFEMRCSKPDVAAFEHVIQHTNITPSRTLFLDDSSLNIAAAQELDFQTVQITPERDLLDVFAPLMSV